MSMDLAVRRRRMVPDAATRPVEKNKIVSLTTVRKRARPDTKGNAGSRKKARQSQATATDDQGPSVDTSLDAHKTKKPKRQKNTDGAAKRKRSIATKAPRKAKVRSRRPASSGEGHETDVADGAGTSNSASSLSAVKWEDYDLEGGTTTKKGQNVADGYFAKCLTSLLVGLGKNGGQYMLRDAGSLAPTRWKPYGTAGASSTVLHRYACQGARGSMSHLGNVRCNSARDLCFAPSDLASECAFCGNSLDGDSDGDERSLVIGDSMTKLWHRCCVNCA